MGVPIVPTSGKLGMFGRSITCPGEGSITGVPGVTDIGGTLTPGVVIGGVIGVSTITGGTEIGSVVTPGVLITGSIVIGGLIGGSIGGEI
jgi:hypothetical protein